MSGILALAAVLISVTGAAALRVINAVLPGRSKKARTRQIYVVQYTAVACCFTRAALDVMQYFLIGSFDTFQGYTLYGVYVFAFIVALELAPLGVLVCVIRIQTKAQSVVGSELQSTLADDRALLEGPG